MVGPPDHTSTHHSQQERGAPPRAPSHSPLLEVPVQRCEAWEMRLDEHWREGSIDGVGWRGPMRAQKDLERRGHLN